MKSGKHGTPAEVIAKVRAVLNPTPEVIALRSELAELRALQCNGFEPIAAARAYPELVSALHRIRGALAALEWGTDAHGALELRHLIDEEEPRLRALLANLGEGQANGD